MATTRQLVLHDNLLEGVDSTLPAHLIGHKWRIQHNFRLTPELEQLPRKITHATIGTEDIRNMAFLPSSTPGYGRTILFGTTTVFSPSGQVYASGLANNSTFRKWAMALYNGTIYYSNDLNTVRANNGSTDVALTGAPKSRYLLAWYDHLVAAHVTENSQYLPSRLLLSNVNNFNQWSPAITNEADFYDFVEWQQLDYPFVGITGIAKIGGTLWVYTPTALIPVRYVGLPKVIQVVEDQVVTNIGNTYPWTLVALDKVNFFYDGIEHMFFAFDGQQVIPIGDPVRSYIRANLNTTPALAEKMHAFRDVDNREIWWVFVSTQSNGAFDKAVVFNYRYKKWFTASVENVMSFCGSTFATSPVSGLAGNVTSLGATPTGRLGLASSPTARLFGTASGGLLREETTNDSPAGTTLTQEQPVLETADFHYGDIRTIKENDQMLLNATMESVLTTVDWSDVSAATLPDTGNQVSFLVDLGRPYKWTPQAGDTKAYNGDTVLATAGGAKVFIAEYAIFKVITANSTATLQTQAYIDIYAQGRNFLGDAVTFSSSDRVGAWLRALQDAMLSYAPKVGRVLRYRFEPKKARFTKVSAFSDIVLVKKAEQ